MLTTNSCSSHRTTEEARSTLLYLVAALFLPAIIAWPGKAQNVPPMEKVLVPIFITGTIPGAYGSEWKSELAMTNRSDQPLAINGIWIRCHLGTCVPDPFYTLPWRTTVFPKPPLRASWQSRPGSLLLIEQARLQDVAFSLRIQDVSRQALTWGTELPVIPESQAFSGRADFLNVPLDDRFRVLLRVYDFTPGPGHRVRVTGYPVDPSVTELPRDPQDLLPAFSIEQDLLPGEMESFMPGYAQIDLTNSIAVPEEMRLLVRVEPLTPFTFWAFINVTNNETQHVTLISGY